MSRVPLGFALDPLMVPLDSIMLSRQALPALSSSRKYLQILSSIKEIGLIEPISIISAGRGPSQYVLLDGHIRLVALRELGFTQAPCLLATDDESFTYNNRVNRLSTIQEHVMIRRAIDRGVAPERLAKALSVDVRSITKKLALLDGICAEATELLRDRQFSADLSRVLRKMKPTRQIECVELMISANNMSISYAEAMLVATPPDQLLDGKKTQRRAGVTQEQMVKMEREMANVQGQYKMVEQTYGQDVLNLVLARGYLAKLLQNKLVVRYLKSRQPEMLDEFQNIVQTTALET